MANVFTYLKKRFFTPSVKEFGYKHNYNALYGYNGKGQNNGVRLSDDRVRFDNRGIPYLPENEEQRLFRYEQYRKNLEKENKLLHEYIYGPLKKLFFIRNLKSRFNWQKTKAPKGSKRIRKLDGSIEWVIPYRPTKTKNMKQWLYENRNK